MSVFKQLFLALMPMLFMQIVAAEPASPRREPGTVLYLLQSELEGRGALYDKGFLPFGSFVMTDGRLVTGQNPGSGKEVAQALLAALRNNTPQ